MVEEAMRKLTERLGGLESALQVERPAREQAEQNLQGLQVQMQQQAAAAPQAAVGAGQAAVAGGGVIDTRQLGKPDKFGKSDKFGMADKFDKRFRNPKGRPKI